MKAKKTLLVLSAATLAATLAACGGESGPTLVESNFINEAPEDLKVSTEGTYVDYSTKNYDERAEILSLLENYAIRNHLTGLTLYADGGLVKYSSRVKIPTKVIDNEGKETQRHESVTGYGFGILTEGYLDPSKPLASKDVVDPTYFQDVQSDDPKTLNMMNDKGSVVSSYWGHIASTYFDLRLNETKDGHEMFASNASDKNVVEGKARPLPLDKDGKKIANPKLDTKSTKYRIYVRTGADFKYGTATENATLKKYNGRPVELDDYTTFYKALWCQANGLKRGAENLSGAQSIKGAQKYYNDTAAGFNQAAWDQVGIKTGHDTDGDYLDFEFNNEVTPYFAQYYLGGPTATPMPQAFLDDLGTLTGIPGAAAFASFNKDLTLTPVDTTLSTGPYVVEKWEPAKTFSFKANPNRNDDVMGGDKNHRYRIPGVHVNIVDNSKDMEAWWKQFKDGKLDGVGVPKSAIKEQKVAPYTQISKGSSTTKLNMNTCTQEEWDSYFGPEGTVAPGAEWELKPCMSNDAFVDAISYSINRKKYAEDRGSVPSVEYFSDNYLSDPENGVSYNDSVHHKEIMKGIYGADWETNYGYDLTKAAELFSQAAKELVEQGKYKSGDTVSFEICWMAEGQVESQGADITTMVTEAWNKAAASEAGVQDLKLEIKHEFVTQWDDVYYKKMMAGQFDVAFGGISGNPMNPLNFFEVLKSSNSSGFTLNFGANTNSAVEGNTIKYDGKDYTFDALWQATDSNAVRQNDGSLGVTSASQLLKSVNAEDGGRDIEVQVAASRISGVFESMIDKVVIKSEEGDDITLTREQLLAAKALVQESEDSDHCVIKIHLTAEQNVTHLGSGMILVYFTQTITDGDKKVTHNVVEQVETEFNYFEEA